MDFPIETTFRANDGTGVIRLKVAAICACLDYEVDGGHYVEEEIAPFFQEIEFDGVTGKYKRQIDPHAFLYIQPTGDLASDVDDVLNALYLSIDKGQLRTVSLKMSLEGLIDPVETWILADDFYKWSASRGFRHGDVCTYYDEGEFWIFDHAAENANDRRKQYEAPYFDVEYEKQLGLKDPLKEITKAQYEKVLLENMIMRQGFPPTTKTEGQPLSTKERNVLLAIIAALCNDAKYDYRRAAKTAGLIKKTAEEMGLHIGESTIESHLKRIPDALETRMR